MPALHPIQPPDAPPPRYSSRPLPPYRHVPGLTPHPVADPRGHSHAPSGEHPTAGPLPPPDRWRDSDAYRFGIDLYNRGFWWEAHEAWEGLWQQSDKSSDQGHFLQGLIQISAAHLKRHVGQEEGVQRLLERARRHLDRPGLAGAYMGVAVRDFLQAVDACFHRGGPFPFLVLDESRPQ